MTRERNTIDPRSEIKHAAAAWLQNLSKTWHTLFHITCEFPFSARTPIAQAAPLPEKSKATIIASSRVTNVTNNLLLCPFARAITKDKVAYANAIKFATTKYLIHEKQIIEFFVGNKNHCILWIAGSDIYEVEGCQKHGP